MNESTNNFNTRQINIVKTKNFEAEINNEKYEKYFEWSNEKYSQ